LARPHTGQPRAGNLYSSDVAAAISWGIEFGKGTAA
jgi:hypothetical protein